MKILVIDNYDSFTYNLVHMLREIVGEFDVDVVRNDAFELDIVENYDKILLSPGPGIPSEAGLMPSLLKKYASTKSILGICLGHQAIGEAFGAKLHNLKTVIHGQTHPVEILDTEDIVFQNLPASFHVGHYHSWVIDKKTLPSSLKITARTADGLVMAVRHEQYDVCGLQFHPESILTEYGKEMLENWVFDGKKRIIQNIFTHATEA